MRYALAALFGLGLMTEARAQERVSTEACAVALHVLGVAQDGGKPQLGNANDPAWTNPSLKRLATSLGLIDRRSDAPKRWLFEATPDIKAQLYQLNLLSPRQTGPVVDGIFLTHAHIGHYVGLLFFGHESMGAQDLAVYAMPKMAAFLRANGPWSQLVKYKNISLNVMQNEDPQALVNGLSVTPLLVPHRQEFSEVVGYRIDGPDRSVLFIPDIDSWNDWDREGTRVEDEIAKVDVAYLDATFFANGEIPGRDMSGFPHPFVRHSMRRFAPLPRSEREKIRFIHMNHTNPLHVPDGDERKSVKAAGFQIAERNEMVCLGGAGN